MADDQQKGKEIDSLLVEREKIYGDHELLYNTAAKIAYALDELSQKSGSPIRDSSMFELQYIVGKLCRLVVNPYYEDNYTDIKGYLELIHRAEIGETKE